MLITELLNVFEKLRKKNPKILLSGSLALFLQNVKLPRLPEDIDIFLPHGEKFIITEEFTRCPVTNTLIYLDDNRRRRSYYYDGFKRNIKIDVFQPINLNDEDEPIIIHNDIPCSHKRDILKYKISHALNGNIKHKEDILYLLSNNDKVYPNIAIERPLLFFDLETTGIDKITDRIIELSTIKYFIDGTFEIKTQRFNPTIPIPESATKVHGISGEDVFYEPTFSEKALEVSNYFSNCDLAGFNILNFDLPLLAEEFLRANIELPFCPNMKVVDSLKIFFKQEKRDLSSAYKFYCGKSLSNAHSAEADSIATVEVLDSQIYRYQLSKSIKDLHDFCNNGNSAVDYDGKFIRNEEGIIVFNFGQHYGESVLDHFDYLDWMLRQNFAQHTKYIIRKIIAGESAPPDTNSRIND
jgi:DNA polymerase-3 subunit epsilon